MNMENVQVGKLRVLIAKLGLDPHDRGAKILGVSLRDAGLEVIYTGLHQVPENIVNSAIQEDVDVICLSILSGAHLPLTRKVMELLKDNGAGDIPVICGGVIPDKDIPALKELKVKEVFKPMTPIEHCIDYIKILAREKGLQSLARTDE